MITAEHEVFIENRETITDTLSLDNFGSLMIRDETAE